VHGNRAEIALAITAAVGGNAEADRLQRAHLALGSVVGMHGMFKIQAVNSIQLSLGEDWGGRVLHQVALGMLLN